MKYIRDNPGITSSKARPPCGAYNIVSRGRRTSMTTTTTFPNIATGEGTNPLKALLTYGQSPWMDYIRRDLLTGDVVKKNIDTDGLRRMTSHPAISENAITATNPSTHLPPPPPPHTLHPHPPS